MSDSHKHPGHPVSPASPPPSPSAPGPVSPEPVDDAGSQALSEALRSSFVIVKVIMVILIIVFFGSGFFTVPSQERAIVLRFGRPLGVGDEQLLGPGAHWSFPYPIDEVVRIPYSQYQTVKSTVGWYATTPEQEALGNETASSGTLNPAADGYALTADANIVHVRATLRYRIERPLDYALKFVNGSNVVQHLLDSSLLYATAHFNVDDVLRLNKTGLKDLISQRVRHLVGQQSLGITVEQVDVETKAPLYVKPFFESVLSAEVERRQTNEIAQSYANSVRTRAIGESNSVVNAGMTEASRLIQQINADARAFKDQLQYFEKNPELFTARVQAEAFQRIFTNTTLEKFPIMDLSGGKPVELRLMLSREPEKPGGQQPPR